MQFPLGKYLFVLYIIFNCFLETSAQNNKYAVFLKDKALGSYTLNNPRAFLSDKALERRKKQNISLAEDDLPVSQVYIDSISAIGLTVRYTSKWLNLAVVETNDSTKLNAIETYAFVKSYKLLFDATANKNNKVNKKFMFERDFPDTLDYGSAKTQIELLNGQSLHFLERRGEGMSVAVFDVGFQNVDKIQGFSHLFEEGRVHEGFDFVDNNGGVYTGGQHGTKVLSTIGAYIEGSYIGAAPAAEFHLYRTEDLSSESLLEELNWVAAAENADSAGVDIINSSLGYTRFDLSSQDHNYKDLDGNTTFITKGADIAASKGILVVNSAGNEGDSDWKYIVAPADGDSVLAVGGTNRQGIYAGLSSKGPSADQRVKPDVMGMAVGPSFIDALGNITYGAGTSYSSPVMAGLIACLWQGYPLKTNMEVIEAVKKSAHQYFNPDTLMGYGIPDFMLASMILNEDLIKHPGQDEVIRLYPNPAGDNFFLVFYSTGKQDVSIRFINMNGKSLIEKQVYLPDNSLHKVSFEGMDQLLPAGSYIVKISTENKVLSEKLIKR